MEITPFIRDNIERVRNYVEKVRGVDDAEFRLWRDEHGIYHAKFKYGREAEGTIYHAIYGAIANVLMPLEDL